MSAPMRGAPGRTVRPSASISRLATSHPQSIVASLALLSRLIPWILLHLLQQHPSFDSSAKILSGEPGSATLRWDAVHFAAIAKDGYQHEQQIAFQPGWPLLLRAITSLLPSTVPEGAEGIEKLVRVGEVLACGSYVGASVMLYRLTALITTPTFALTTSLLYLIPPAPAVLSSAFTEPLFALLTFAGFYSAIKRRFLVSSLLLAGATSVRATGVLAVGPLVWMLLFGDEPLLRCFQRPSRSFRRLALAVVSTGIVVAPFALSQAYFYFALCQGTEAEPWCSQVLPLAYSQVQERYWNIGMLNYWTPAQIPNIILASPVLVISFFGTYCYAISVLQSGQSAVSIPSASSNHQHSFLPSLLDIPAATSNRRLLPFYIHSFALTLLLLFGAHTQIALRVCVTDPVIWWSLAGLAFGWHSTARPTGSAAAVGKGKDAVPTNRCTERAGMTPIGKAWVWWTVVYGAISIVLWAGHYPPA